MSIFDKEYDRITDDIMEKIEDAITCRGADISDDAMDELVDAICDGTEDALRTGSCMILPYRVEQLQFSVRVSRAGSGAQANCDWVMLAGFPSRDAAEDYKKQLEQSNPDEHYEVFDTRKESR